jgi:hypothetical protein
LATRSQDARSTSESVPLEVCLGRRTDVSVGVNGPTIPSLQAVLPNVKENGVTPQLEALL